MSFTREREHVEKALARVVEQFKTSPRLNALLSLFAERDQLVDDQFWELYTERWVDTATGVQLDALGGIVGQEREGRDDATFRLWISARVVANRSNGHPDDTLRILELISAGADYSLEETPPAAYLVNTSDLSIDPQSIFNLLTLAKPAGVRMNLTYNPDADLAFTFSDIPDETTAGDDDKGFGDTSDPLVGGQLSGIL